MLLGFRIQHTGKAIHKLKVFHNGPKTIAADLGIEGFDDDFDIFPSQPTIELVIFEALQRHDRRDLPLRHQLSAEIEERGQIDVRQVVRLVWVGLLVRRRGDVAGGWTGGHQRMP